MRAVTDNEGEADFRHPDPVMDEALEMVLRRQAGEVDQSTLNAWMAEGADRSEALSRVRALYECPALTVASAQTASVVAPQVKVMPQSSAVNRRLPLLPLTFAAGIAAAAIVPLVGSDWLLDLQADYRTAAGEIVTIELPDGSRMQMNSRSAVSLDFDNGQRAVNLLKGEAYFEVAHDTARPFTVTGGYGTVTVTGTAFDVARGDVADLVHLQSGRVILTHGDAQSSSVSMMPGQSAAVDRRQIALLPQSDGESRLAWREGWIQLSAVSLRAALDDIGRHADLTIVTWPTAALDTLVSGSFRIAEADAAIDSVATAAGARVERLPGGILFIR